MDWNSALPAMTALLGVLMTAIFSARANHRRLRAELESQRYRDDREDKRRAKQHERSMEIQRLTANVARGDQKHSEAKRVAIEVYQASTAHVLAGQRIGHAKADGDANELENADREFDRALRELMGAADTAEFLLPESLHSSITALVQATQEAAQWLKDKQATENAELSARVMQRRNAFSAAVHEYLKRLYDEEEQA
jgi:hypothetical protein